MVSTRHGTISHYFINCSAQRARDEQTVTLHPHQLYITLNLVYHNTLYQCCVSAVNQAGMGTPLCKLIITPEAGKIIVIVCTANHSPCVYTSSIVPSAPPTNVGGYTLNSTSIVLFWQPPPTENSNGFITHYYIEISNFTDTLLGLTTKDTHLLVNNLDPGSYTFVLLQLTLLEWDQPQSPLRYSQIMV